MTRSRRFAHVTLSSARWLLPWIAVLFVSATLAYGMNIVTSGSASASGRQMLSGEAAAVTAREQSTTLSTTAVLADGDDVRTRFVANLANAATSDGSHAPGTCSGMGSGPTQVGVDSWIVAEGQDFACESGKPSPASTGHASPNGCCTWD